MRDLLAALPTNDSKVEPQPYIMDDAFLLNAGTFAVDDDGYFVDEHGPDTDTNTDSSSLSVQSASGVSGEALECSTCRLVCQYVVPNTKQTPAFLFVPAVFHGYS